MGGHPDIDANIVDDNNIGGDAHRFDNIDSSDSASGGDNSDSGGGGGSTEYNGTGFQFDGGGCGDSDDFGVFNFCKGVSPQIAYTNSKEYF